MRDDAQVMVQQGHQKLWDRQRHEATKETFYLKATARSCDAQLDGVPVPIDQLPGDGAGTAPSGRARPWGSSQESLQCHSSHPSPS